MFLFLVSHLGADYPSLSASLLSLPYLRKISLLDQKNLSGFCVGHCRSPVRIWMDVCIYNRQLAHKSLYRNSKFIFLLAKPGKCLPLMADVFGDNCLRHYRHRLHRIGTIASQCTGGLLLTEINEKSLKAVGDYIGTKRELPLRPGVMPPGDVGIDLLEEGKKIYDSYYGFLKKSKLNWV